MSHSTSLLFDDSSLTVSSNLSFSAIDFLTFLTCLQSCWGSLKHI